MASFAGQADAVTLLLNANANPNLPGILDATPLYVATLAGHTDIVTSLLNANANPNLRIEMV